MARNYPRFLFSNPKNTKSPGPFVVHLLKPRMICKIYEARDATYNADDHPNALHFGRFAVELLEAWDEATSLKYSEIMREANNWLNNQSAAPEFLKKINLKRNATSEELKSLKRYKEKNSAKWHTPKQL
jgi:hypothetical protein